MSKRFTTTLFNLKLAALAILALASLSCLPAAAKANVYWTNNNGTIGRANLDGSGVNQSFISGATTSAGVAIDSEHIYWGNSGAFKIGRANLDGSAVNQNFVSGPTNLVGIAVDAAHVYWANYGSGVGTTIGRANLDGSGVNQSFISGASGPLSVAVDNSHVYWANFNADTIGRANLDGSGVNQNFISAASSPVGVAVDGGHIYWSNFWSGTIGRANLDGSGVNQSFIGGASSPRGVAVNDGHVYWANLDTDTIGRANLDGSQANPAWITGANDPFGVAAGQPFAGATPASLAFGSPTPVPQGMVSAPQSVTYANTGTADLIFRGFSFSGANPGDYMTSSDTCHAAVAPGDSCSVQIRFVPQAQGSRSATLTALTNAVTDPSASLSGTAGPPLTGPTGPTGPAGPTGPTGPQGLPGRDARVTCKVKGTRKKPKVKCTVTLVNPGARIRWRLTHRKRTVAYGISRVHHNRVKLPVSRLANLHHGRYSLRVGGRRTATFVVE